MVKALLLVAERINYSSEFNLNYIGTATYSQIPPKDSLIEVRNQDYVGYRVQEIIFLQSNDSQYDVVLLLGSALIDVKRKAYNSAILSINIQKSQANAQARVDKERFTNPDVKWQEKKEIYTRVEAGEKMSDIASEKGLSRYQISRRYNDWKYLLVRRSRQIREEESNG